jgi:hypothetical protein
MNTYLLPVIALYIASLCLPAAVLSGGISVTGLDIFLVGWGGIVVLLVAWYANIFGIAAFAFAYFKKEKVTFICSVIAFILGLQSYFWSHFNLPKEWGLDYLTIGFYLWELSFLVLSIHSFLQLRKNKKHN